MEYKEFRSNSADERYIALLSGHTFRIGRDWVDIPEFAWTDCYSNGCISKDMLASVATSVVDENVLQTLTKVATRKDDIKNILEKWVKENNREKFSKDGKPHLMKLAEELGYRPSKGHVEEIWFKLQEDMK